MTDHTLTITRSTHPTGTTLVKVTGELDYHTAPELTRAIEETSFSADDSVVFDLTDLTYCDSTGITVLVIAYQHAQKGGSRLTLAGLNADLMRVFQVVGLDQIFTFQPTVEQALTRQPS